MKTKNDIKKCLAARIDRFIESGEPEVRLSYMLPEVDGNLDLLNELLCEWMSEGKIEWILPLDNIKNDIPVVRFSHYTLKHVPWRRN